MQIQVLMPVRNNAPHLRAAIDSVLRQTMPEFQILVLDDGSTDGSREIVQAYLDPRVVLVDPVGPPGLVARLNQGLAMLSAPFVARMDGDDLAMPTRFATQLAWLQRDPSLLLVGSAAVYAGERRGRVPLPFGPDACAGWSVFGSPCMHPTWLFRRELVERHKLRYRDVPHAEDYAFLLDTLRLGRIDNVPATLLAYRIHPASVSRLARDAQIESTRALYAEILTRLLGAPPRPEELETHAAIGLLQPIPDRRTLDRHRAWLEQLRERTGNAAIAAAGRRFLVTALGHSPLRALGVAGPMLALRDAPGVALGVFMAKAARTLRRAMRDGTGR